MVQCDAEIVSSRVPLLITMDKYKKEKNIIKLMEMLNLSIIEHK